MVVGTVHRAAGESGYTVDRERVGPFFRPAAQGIQRRRGGGEAVAFLHAQAGGVHKAGGALPDGGHHRQRRQQVRAAGDIDVHIAGAGEACVMLCHHPIPLGGMGVQTQNINGTAQSLGGVPEARLGPIGFHGDVPGTINLVPGDAEGLVAFLLHGDTEFSQHIQGHIHISAGLQRRCDLDDGIPRQQRQGVQQTRDELAGHVARQTVSTRRQSAPHKEGAVFALIVDALFLKDIEVGLLGPLHEPAAAGEHAASRHRQGDGNEKAESGAGLAAVQQGQRPCWTGSFQGLHTPFGGLDVLGVFHIEKVACAVRQRQSQHRPVGHGLAGGRGHGAGQAAGLDTNVHLSPPRPRR